MVLQPADGVFDLPSIPITSQRPSILSAASLSSISMRCDLFDPALLECVPQPVRVSRLVVEKTLWAFLQDPHINKSLNGVDLGNLRRCCERGYRDTPAVRHQHELGSLSFLGLTHLKTPFVQAKRCRHPLPATSPATFAGPSKEAAFAMPG